MVAADPVLGKLFQSYLVVQGMQMFGAFKHRKVISPSGMFTPCSKL